VPRSRYARWDGRQDPLGERADIPELLDRLADDLLMGSGGRSALDQLRRRGMPGRRGTDALRRSAGAEARELRERLATEDPLAPYADALDEVVDIEREALAQRDDEAARFDELRLDALPPDPAGRFRELGRYDFSSPEAGARFEALADQLRKDLLDAHLQALTGALEAVTPEDVARIAAMLGDLNELVEARAANGGEPPADEPERFAAFVERHRDLLPEVVGSDGVARPPRDLDELLGELARRAQAAQAFLRSLSPVAAGAAPGPRLAGVRRPRPRVPARPARAGAAGRVPGRGAGAVGPSAGVRRREERCGRVRGPDEPQVGAARAGRSAARWTPTSGWRSSRSSTSSSTAATRGRPWRTSTRRRCAATSARTRSATCGSSRRSSGRSNARGRCGSVTGSSS
jgi:hypothetical protein